MSDIFIESYHKIQRSINSCIHEGHLDGCVSLIENLEKEISHLQNPEHYPLLVRMLYDLYKSKSEELKQIPVPTPAKYSVLSLSGGMDSTCLLVKLLSEGREVLAISFKYGQKHSVELKLASKNIEYLQSKSFKVTHQIVDLTTAFRGIGSSLITEGVEVPEGHYQESNMKSTVVPNRNAIFSAIIYAHALSLSEKYSDGVNKEPVDISLGIHSGDHEIYPDCRIEFRDAIDKAFKLGNYDSRLISYYTPYINGTKTSILHDCLNNCKALDLSFPTILANTITSYNPDELGRSSGKSGSDIERIEAFLNLGLVDPIAYQEPWEEVVKHAMGVLSRA